MPNVSPTIHIVDDDESFRAGVANLLGACGYGVKQYASAEQLMRDPPIGEFGCILLDLQLPKLSGLELQGHLALTCCTVPVIFVSGRRDIAATVKSIKAGAEDFLTKLRRRLEAAASPVPVIFMTAVDSQMVRGEALTAGCVAYLLKPFAPYQLLDAIERATP